MSPQTDDPRIAVIRTALARHEYAILSAREIARQIVGALDRQRVLDELGIPIDWNDPLEADPAPRDDDRVEAVARALLPLAGRDVTAGDLACHALAAFDRWRYRRELFRIELAWLLDGTGL